MVPRGFLWLGLVCLSGSTLPLPAASDPPDAAQFWEAGQAAMRRGNPDEAIARYRQSLAADPAMTCNYLSLAAAYLEKQDLAQACCHLRQYLELNPEHVRLRARYAELLVRLHRLAEAEEQLERVLADLQEQAAPAAEDLLHCHTRLVEIAEEAEDEYSEHLHRGIGLLLLARRRSRLPEPEGELPAEGLLCRAAAELTLARVERPEEARPCWYLYEVWSQLGQRQPALCRLREAGRAAPFSYLTPAEQCRLQLACQNDRAGTQRR